MSDKKPVRCSVRRAAAEAAVIANAVEDEAVVVAVARTVNGPKRIKDGFTGLKRNGKNELIESVNNR